MGSQFPAFYSSPGNPWGTPPGISDPEYKVLTNAGAPNSIYISDVVKVSVVPGQFNTIKVDWPVIPGAVNYTVFRGFSLFFSQAQAEPGPISANTYTFQFKPSIPTDMVMNVWVQANFAIPTPPALVQAEPASTERLEDYFARVNNPLETSYSNLVADNDYMRFIAAEIRRRAITMIQNDGEWFTLYIRRWSGTRCNCNETEGNLLNGPDVIQGEVIDPAKGIGTEPDLSADPQNDALARCPKCVLPGTKITLADFTRKAVEDIVPGDMVLTHKGVPSRVTQVLCRDAAESVIHIHSAGKQDPLSVTQEHPVLAIRRTSKWNLHKLVDKHFPEWVLAKDLKVGDMVLLPVPQQVDETIGGDMARLAGYYAAEGSAKNSWVMADGGRPKDRALFSFNQDEADYISEVAAIAGRLGHSAGVEIRPQLHSACVRICSKPITQRLIELCGEYSTQKKLSPILTRLGIPETKAFLGAYTNGDGCCQLATSGFAPAVSTKWATASPALAEQIYLLLAKCEIPAAFSMRKNSDPKTREKRFTIYEIESRGRAALALQEHSTKVVRFKDWSPRQDITRIFKPKNHDFIVYPITKLETTDYVGKVHNLEVDSHHSYVANNVVVHNCYGTGIIGGYYYGIPTYMRYGNLPQRQIIFKNFAIDIPHNFNTWTLWEPKLHTHDVVHRQKTGEYFEVGEAARGEWRAVPFHQECNLKLLPPGDHRYKVTTAAIQAVGG